METITFNHSLFTLLFICINSEFKFINIKLIMDDVVIIGGGIIGAATAYFLSKEGRKVKVIERDPTYKKASFPLSLGGFRRQFYQKENILLGKFAREFIFQIPELLKTKKNPILQPVWFLPVIYLCLDQNKLKNNIEL